MEPRNTKGFTLIDLLITLSVLSILIFQVVPSFRQLINSSTLTTSQNQFLSAVQYARSEAVTHNYTTYMCARSELECSGDNQWEDGWIIYSDLNNNGQLDDEGEILRVFDSLSSGFTLRPNINTSAFKFMSDGVIRKVNGSLPMMTLTLCSPNANEQNIENNALEIVLNRLGRARIQKGIEGDTECNV